MRLLSGKRKQLRRSVQIALPGLSALVGRHAAIAEDLARGLRDLRRINARLLKESGAHARAPKRQPPKRKEIETPKRRAVR